MSYYLAILDYVILFIQVTKRYLMRKGYIFNRFHHRTSKDTIVPGFHIFDNNPYIILGAYYEHPFLWHIFYSISLIISNSAPQNQDKT